MLMQVLALVLVTPCSALVHANGLLELRIRSGAAFTQIDSLEHELNSASAAANGVLLVIEDGEEEDAALLASLDNEARTALLRREHALRSRLREMSRPIIAVGSGRRLEGAAAGLFLAAEHRLVSQQTMFSLTACRFGLVPGAIAELVSTMNLADATSADKRALAMAVALGAMPLNAHDVAHVLGALFSPAADVPALLHELRRAPSSYLDVPLTRRCAQPPAELALLAQPLVAKALRNVFGGGSDGENARAGAGSSRARGARSAAAMRRALAKEVYDVDRLLDSCAWHTRECAEAVSDVLHAATFALDDARSSPHALALTARVLQRGLDAAGTAGADVGTVETTAQHALMANARLATRRGFADDLTRRRKRWLAQRPPLGLHVS